MMRTELPLPEEVIPPSTARGMAWTWIGAAAVLVGANFAAGWFLRHFSPNPFDHEVRDKWALAERTPFPYDSLILGDSTGNQGVNPGLLNRELGVGKWANLATVGDMLVVGDAWMLQEVIERHGPPRRILLVHVPDIWRRGVKPEVLATIPRPWGFWSRYNPELDFDAAGLRTAFLVKYVPLYANDQSLRTALMTPWKINDNWQVFTEDGFMPVSVQFRDVMRRGLDRQAQSFRRESPSISPVNEAAFQALIALADQHGFDVYFANGTAHETLANLPAYRHHYQVIAARLRELAGDSPRFHVLLEEPIGLPDRLMSDHEHATVEGAEHYTRLLADKLRPLVTP